MMGRTLSAVYCPSDVVLLSTNVNQFTNLNAALATVAAAAAAGFSLITLSKL